MVSGIARRKEKEEMPCNSDYLDPTTKEEELQRTAKLIVYVCERLGQVPDPTIVEHANDLYCDADYLVPLLCAKLSGLDDDDFDSIVYCPYSRMSRDLANWWEDHSAADLARNLAEALTTMGAKETGLSKRDVLDR